MMTGFLGPAERERLQTIFENELPGDVQLILFAQPPSGLIVPGREESQTGRQARRLMEELAELSPRLHLEVHDPRRSPELAKAYGVERTPALILRPWPGEPEGAAATQSGPADEGAPPDAGAAPDGDAPFGLVRFFGLPAGYEFATLLEDLQDISRRRTRLAPATREYLASVPGQLHLQVFVTPT